MEYHEAAEIAKRSPGSVLTRDALGSFIVRLSDGTVAGASYNTTFTIDTSPGEREEHLDQLSRARVRSISWEDSLLAEITDLNQKCTALRVSLAAATIEAAQVTQALEALRAENTALQSQLAKVSDAEWERVRESDRLHREADAAQRKAVRRVIKCACSGEVENCVRCFGAGDFIVDGYGNQV